MYGTVRRIVIGSLLHYDVDRNPNLREIALDDLGCVYAELASRNYCEI